MSDFELIAPAPSSRKRKPEGAALVEVLRTLRAHPAVGWCHRMNTGAGLINGRYIRFGFTGLSDVLGQLTDGRVLAVEVKAVSGRLSEEQAAFIELVNAFGGVAFVARDANDVYKNLKESI